MKILLQKRPEGLFPLYPVDEEKLTNINNGETIEIDIKKMRNPEFHRLVFRFLNIVFSYQDQFTDFEQFRRVVKWRSGCYKEYMIDDKMFTELDSWNFEKCDEYQFKEIFKQIKTACWEKFIPNFSEEDIQRAEAELLAFE
jgi:hypothetical protein